MNRRQGSRYVFVILLLACMGSTSSHAETVTYVYTDPQGTVLVETDDVGNITAEFDYRPYGRQALGSPPNGPGFTGHVSDADTGLVYMQARYYDSDVGRFLSIDPAPAEPGAMDSFNLYRYAMNNPYRYVDPDGRRDTCSTGSKTGFCGSVSVTQVNPSGLDGLTRAPNAAIGQAAASAANQALGDTLQTKYPSMDKAARAWAGAVVPVTAKFRVEIGSKLFQVRGGYQFGTAVSDGAGTTVEVKSAPVVEGGTLYGYIHTHPVNIGFSPQDLHTALVLSRDLLNPVTAYVSLPNNDIFKWSTQDLTEAPGRQWSFYLNRAERIP